MAVRLIENCARVSQILFEIGAVHCDLDRPFVFTSGWASPVYVNCRKLLSTTWQRREIIQLAAEEIERDIGREGFDVVAGGETAGIPFAAWIAEYFYRPMIYVRKARKQHGLQQEIEGSLEPGQRTILVEDLTTDGSSKIYFCDVFRRLGATVDHAISVFYYGVYPDTERKFEDANLCLHALTDWRTTLEVGAARGHFDSRQAAAVNAFLDDPAAWSAAHGGAGAASSGAAG